MTNNQHQERTWTITELLDAYSEYLTQPEAGLDSSFYMTGHFIKWLKEQPLPSPKQSTKCNCANPEELIINASCPIHGDSSPQGYREIELLNKDWYVTTENLDKYSGNDVANYKEELLDKINELTLAVNALRRERV